MSGNNNKSSRPTKGYSTKAVSVVLAGAIALSGAGAAFADSAVPTTTAATTTAVTAPVSSSAFTDVKSGFWAEKHIYKLAAQGIVIGNNGNFRPNDPVTQQEAVLMALRFMKLQNMVDKDGQVALPADFKVSNYYKSYVVLAFQQKLLDKTLEMAPTNLTTSWGERKATREWIAEVLIRALGKSTDAVTAANEPTGFADDAKVSASKRGYINVAVDLGLANGLEGNRFDPQGNVTRAQLATFFSRAQAQNSLVYDNTTTGTVTELKDGKITLYDNGKSSIVSLSPSTAYFSSTSEVKVSLNDIKPYMKLMVIGTNNNASYVEIIDPKPQVESIQGSFAMITGTNKLFLKTADGYPEYAIDANTSFFDASGAKIEANSITADSLVSLLRETYSGTKKVISVQVTTGVVNKSTTGTIKSVDLTGKSLTFKNASGVEETFKWEDNSVAKFFYKNTILAPSELQVGSAVSYTIKNNLIQSVEVTVAVERTLQGMLYELSTSTVVYKKSDGTKDVKLIGTAAPVIVIPGISNPQASDLIADTVGGDNIKLTLNSSDQVVKIEVVSRQIEFFGSMTVDAYNAKNKLLTAIDSSNKPHLFTLDDKTKLINEGALPTLATLSTFLTEGRKINVSAIGQRTFSLEVVTKYEGTVTSINAATQKIAIKTTDGQNLSLPIPYAVDIFGRTNVTIADVAIGSTVTAVMAGNQEIISVLRVKSAQQVIVTSLDSSTNRMNVKWGDNTSSIYTSTATLSNEAGQTLKLTDFKAGDYVNVVAMGSTPTSLQLVKITLGQVMILDTTAGTIGVKDYTGVTQTISTSNNVKIVRAGVTSTSLPTLAVNERVEIRKEADGATNIRVLPQLTRAFSSFDTTTNQLVVKRSNTTDNNRFPLASNAFIHQGDTTLTVQSLKENDNITVYFNNDVIIEIVKQ